VSHDNSDDITSVQWLRLHRHTTTMHMILAKPECARWISSRSTKAGGLTYTPSSYIHKMPLTVSLRVQNVVHDSTFEGSTKAGGLTTASSYIHGIPEGAKCRPRQYLWRFKTSPKSASSSKKGKKEARICLRFRRMWLHRLRLALHRLRRVLHQPRLSRPRLHHVRLPRHINNNSSQHCPRHYLASMTLRV
jgi:hypothetical protein